MECNRCEQDKSLDSFRFRSDINWRVKQCKDCESAAAKVYYKEFKFKDPIKWRIQTLRLNRSPHITLEWINAELNNQNHQCAISGRPIDILSLEVDHIVPRSKGGCDDLANLQLVCREANSAKGGMTQEELVVLCQEIIGRAIMAIDQCPRGQ